MPGGSGKKVVDRNDIISQIGRFVYADPTTAQPTVITDVIDNAGVLAAGWNDFGATDGGLNISKSFETTEIEVDQLLAAVDEQINKHSLVLSTNLVEISIENLQLVWQGDTITNNATPDPTEDSMPFGSPTCATERMVAFIVDKYGACDLSANAYEYIRIYVFYRARLSGADSAHSFTKGEKSLLPIELKCYPDTTKSANANFGIVLDQVNGSYTP